MRGGALCNGVQGMVGGPGHEIRTFSSLLRASAHAKRQIVEPVRSSGRRMEKMERRTAWVRLAIGLGVGIVLLAALVVNSIAADKPECPESLEDLEQKLQVLQEWKARQEENIRKMKEELALAKAENRAPDVSKIGNVMANAAGARSKEYQQAPPYIQALVEKVEKNPLINAFGVLGLMGGISSNIKEGEVTTAQAHYSVEIKRTGFLKRFMESDAKRVQKCIEQKKGTKSECPPDAGSGGYLIACDPGMGDGEPVISDADPPGFGGGFPPEGPTSGAAGDGPTVDQPGHAPPPGGAGGAPPPGQTPPQGIWCYDEKTKDWYMILAGTCPSSGVKPTGVQMPWDTVPTGDTPSKGGKPSAGGGGKPTPGGGKPTPGGGGKPPPTGGGGCGPGTSCTCAGGGIGHIPCDTSKGSCHCGGG